MQLGAVEEKCEQRMRSKCMMSAKELEGEVYRNSSEITHIVM